jgi:RND family efflux transporter MFP subunit
MTRRTSLVSSAVVLAAVVFAVVYGARQRIAPASSPASTTTTPAREPETSNETAQQIGSPRATIEIDPRRQQLIGVRTTTARRQHLAQSIRAVGIVRYDETRQVDVNVKVEGWIRELMVDYTGQAVQKGQPLFTLYSPQLLTAENEFLLALKSRDQMQQSQIADARQRADELVAAAQQRLTLWDLSSTDLVELNRDRQPHSTVTFTSPAGGFVVEKQALRGMHVTPGQTLYKIADTSVVWVEADLYEKEIPLLRVGQSATVKVDAYPNDRFTGRVAYIYPYLDENTRTNRVRYQLANRSGRLKPGMYVAVEIAGAAAEGIVIPRDALLDSGTEQVVFVATGGGMFEPRHVKVGHQTGDGVQVLEGVQDGEQVASGAAFFIDSESQLRGSIQSYEPTQHVPRDAHQTQLGIALRSIPNPPKVGENQFEVVVKDAAGQPIEGADVRIQFFLAAMPAMNMPAMRSETRLAAAGKGTYRGTGQLPTTGSWDATVVVARNGERLGSRQLAVVVK